jgi:hypothetical protein
MRLPVYRCLPAFVAALLIAALPSCASLNDPLLEATFAEVHERGLPVINRELKPVAEGAPTCITRGAGMDFDPPSIEGISGTDALYAYLALAVFYALFFLGYCFGYACYKLGEVIWEACDSPADAAEEEADGEPDEKHMPQPYPRND